jgi:hypothetical protein
MGAGRTGGAGALPLPPMPIIYRAASGGLPDLYLLLVQPDWTPGIRISYTLASEQAEGLSGIEYRAPEHLALRLRLKATLVLDASDTDQLRQALAVLGSRRFGVPLWPDAVLPQASWLHLPQKVVSWNDAGAYAITAPQGSYTYPNAAPLMVGRLSERPVITPFGGGLYEVGIEIVEDSSHDLRIAPAAGSTPTDFSWEPDWSDDIEDISRDQLRASEIGRGREQAVAGGEGTPRWGEEAGFTLTASEAAQFLRFWASRLGSVSRFSVPAWSKPGANLPATPGTYVGRFDRDVLDLHFRTPAVIETSVRIWAEVAQVGDPLQSGDGEAYLYAFAWEGGSVLRLTNWESSLTYSANAYAPGRVSHDELRLSLTALGDEVDIEIFAEEAGNPLKPLLQGEAERVLKVEIWKARVNSSGAVTSAVSWFSGTIPQARHEDDRLIGHAVTLGGKFRRQAPGFVVQRGCNYTLFSPECGLLKASWQKQGSLSGTFPGSTIDFTPNVPPSGGYAGKWFAGGWLEVTGADGQLYRRAVLDCSQAGSVWTLKLNRFLPATCSGRTATVYPGCPGDYSACKGKFSNGLNFGGHPYVPAFIATDSGSGGRTAAK